MPDSGIFRRIRLHPSTHGIIWYCLWTFIIIEGIVKLIFRWFTGRDLLHPANERPTNATFLQRGTKTYDPRARLSFWAYMPEWKRAIIRTLTTINFFYLLAWWLFNSSSARTVVVASITLGLFVLIRHIIASHRLRKIRREYITPLGYTIAPILNNDRHNVAEWLTIPPKLINIKYWAPALPSWLPTFKVWLRYKQYRRNKHETPTAIIHYPNDLNVDQRIRQAITDNVNMKLGDADWVIQWHSIGSDPYISIVRKPEPPELVTFTDIQGAVQRASDAAPVMGRSAYDYVSVNLDTEAPHVAVSCGSGAGKSELLKGLIAQWLHNNTLIILLDSKRISQHWCKDHPNVIYCRTATEFFKNLVWLSEEIDRRFAMLAEIPADQELDLDVGQRIICVFEEQNIGMQNLVEDWQNSREKGDPSRSPAISAYNTITATGRQVKAHMFSVAQLFTVACCGGNPMTRANYGVRILARATHQAWEMLASECKPYPKLPNKRGRMALAVAGEVTIYQSALWSTKEARTWAFDIQDDNSTPVIYELKESANSDLVSLAKAATDNVVPYKYGTLRNLKSSDPKFPAAINGKYRKEDLEKWHHNRITKAS